MIVSEFRGGSDEKMSRMWLGRRIELVSLPTLVRTKFFSLVININILQFYFILTKIKI